jgi:hypothetical protein
LHYAFGVYKSLTPERRFGPRGGKFGFCQHAHAYPVPDFLKLLLGQFHGSPVYFNLPLCKRVIALRRLRLSDKIFREAAQFIPGNKSIPANLPQHLRGGS